jgi:hypothetical protein
LQKDVAKQIDNADRDKPKSKSNDAAKQVLSAVADAAPRMRNAWKAYNENAFLKREGEKSRRTEIANDIKETADLGMFTIFSVQI